MIAGNWKMNTTVAEAAELALAVRQGVKSATDVDRVLCPPFVSLAAVKEVLEGSGIRVGAQNLYYEPKGAFTGEVSPAMLAGLCDYVIIGHSERRQYFGETGEIVNRKMAAALEAGLKPILCIGEKLEENEAGRTEEVVTGQLRDALSGLECSRDLVVAYEPIWAIGTGRAAVGRDVNETAALIRSTVGDVCGKVVAEGARILYGGSVTADNIAEFVEQFEIDGALVGGASLKAGEFTSIVKITEETFFPNNPPTKDLVDW
jgi:triosephosphate isomerase